MSKIFYVPINDYNFLHVVSEWGREGEENEIKPQSDFRTTTSKGDKRFPKKPVSFYRTLTL